MFEMNLNSSTLIIIVIGSIIGAIKANFSNNSSSSCNSIINGLLSIFVGILVAEHYSDSLTTWLSGLVALTSSMLSVAILETLHDLIPVVIKILVKLKLGVKNDL